MEKLRVIVPLPNYGFDPTEVSIPWKIIKENGFEIIFASPNGEKAMADNKMVTGESLGIWKNILMARQDAIDAYNEMEKTKSFCNPLKYSEIDQNDFRAILLPGGHDKGVKEYLESKVLQKQVVNFFRKEKIVGAICHGVVLAARSIDPITNKSVLFNYKTTALLKSQELTAYNMTRLWLKDYYLTYPEIKVEDEVKAVLSKKENFLEGPKPLLRDNLKHLERGFTVRDRNYLSSRWPGDAYNFSLEFLKMITEYKN